MLMSYVVDKFPEIHSPTIYDKFSTSITVNGRRISVTMCDTAGQDDFAHLRPLCYPQVDVALICFSVIDPDSYESVKSKWIKEVRRNCPGVPVMIVGTQTDRRDDPTVIKRLKSQGKRPLSKTDGNKLASQCKASRYIECSALTQQNVKTTFDEAIAAGLELNSSTKHTPQCTGCTIL
jgi:small GTP-binding protein